MDAWRPQRWSRLSLCIVTSALRLTLREVAAACPSLWVVDYPGLPERENPGT